MTEFFAEWWGMIVPMIAMAVAAFFPQLKPILDLLIKHKPTPKPRVEDDDPQSDLLTAVQAIQLVIDHFEGEGNTNGAERARQVAQLLFGDLPLPPAVELPTPTRAKAK